MATTGPGPPLVLATLVGAVGIPCCAIVSVTVALCWIPPPFPVTVMEYVPAAVLDPTATVIVELPPPGAAIVPGLKLTVVPLGAPEADRLIELLKPPLAVVVMVEVP